MSFLPSSTQNDASCQSFNFNTSLFVQTVQLNSTCLRIQMDSPHHPKSCTPSSMKRSIITPLLLLHTGTSTASSKLQRNFNGRTFINCPPQRKKEISNSDSSTIFCPPWLFSTTLIPTSLLSADGAERKGRSIISSSRVRPYNQLSTFYTRCSTVFYRLFRSPLTSTGL